MHSVLVVEDADSLREVLACVLDQEGYNVKACASAEEALKALQCNSFDCMVADFKLPQMNGLELLKRTRELHPQIPFLVMTAFGSIELAVDAMKMGANDFISKPFESQSFCRAVKDLIEHKRIVERSGSSRPRRERNFISADAATQKLLQQAKKVAAVDSSVLILGESGTGKELLARHIHQHSQRKDKPFIAINCAATPADLLESEFFGHEAGAFTGATQGRAGVFELASEGTLFLDEIGEMPRPLQVKLLRALQEREVKRLGGNRSIKVNPRIITATNHDIEDALQDGTLREDLYYRIAVISLQIAPLRERPNDIESLASYYLDYFSMQCGKQLTLDPLAMDFLKSYHWPGNARELENVIERATVLAQDIITPEHLGLKLALNFQALEESTKTLGEIARVAAQQAESSLIEKTLQKTLGNKAKAAQILGVSYKTLLNKVREYGLVATSTEG